MFTKKTYPENALLNEYLDFLRVHQSSSEATVVIRRLFVSPFLLRLDVDQSSEIRSLTAKYIHDYIIETAPPLNRASKKHLTSSIRSFLRFLFIKGYLIHNLVEVVPLLMIRKLEYLPKGISWDSIQTLLTMPKRDTPIGRRDLAVMMLCVYYGVRIGQVTTLKLNDIHWQDGYINFSGCKWSNSLRLPLLEDVAQALLAYINLDRRNPDFDEVFLSLDGKNQPLSEFNHYSSNFKKYYIKAGLSPAVGGTRHFRHAFASRLLSQKVSIKTIADLLGHRHIETTFIYTKVDVKQLRTLAREWPEVEK